MRTLQLDNYFANKECRKTSNADTREIFEATSLKAYRSGSARQAEAKLCCCNFAIYLQS